MIYTLIGCVSIHDMHSLTATDMLYSPIQRPRAKKNAVWRAFILKFNPRVAPTYVQACLYIRYGTLSVSCSYYTGSRRLLEQRTKQKKDNRSHTRGPCVQISVDVLMVTSVK